MPEILVLQHIECEPLGTIEAALFNAGLTHRSTRAYNNEPIPGELGNTAGLIIMGGPMGVGEQAQFPYLTDEMRLIEQALARELPVLGVCLGGQLLASVLGASVRKAAQQEIGWHTVTLSAIAATDALFRAIPVQFTGFHWHGDAFDLPAGAVALASSELTPCQAFRYGDSAYGLQMHMEVTDSIIRDWTADFDGELSKAGLEASVILDGISQYLPPLQQAAQEVFGQWANLAVNRSQASR